MSGPAYAAGFRGSLPDINDLVRVSVAGSGPAAHGAAADGIPSRVENVVDVALVGGRRYMIAAPRYPGDSELPQVGTPCTLEWPGSQGLWILPVSFTGEELAREELRVWVVDTIGPARQRERRSYMRVAWALPVSLSPMSAADVRRAVAGGLKGPTMAAAPTADVLPEAVTGETSDISEGGVRLLLPEPCLPVGLGVVVHLDASGQQFTLPSRVRWIRHTGRTDALQFEMAVAFDSPDNEGDRLRPLLFAEQLRLRRAGLA